VGGIFLSQVKWSQVVTVLPGKASENLEVVFQAGGQGAPVSKNTPFLSWEGEESNLYDDIMWVKQCHFYQP